MGQVSQLETGSPASVQREAHGLYNWGKDLALEIPSARGGVCVREREHKRGTCDGLDRAWSWSPGQETHTPCRKEGRQKCKGCWGGL